MSFLSATKACPRAYELATTPMISAICCRWRFVSEVIDGRQGLERDGPRQNTLVNKRSLESAFQQGPEGKLPAVCTRWQDPPCEPPNKATGLPQFWKAAVEAARLCQDTPAGTDQQVLFGLPRCPSNEAVPRSLQWRSRPSSVTSAYMIGCAAS